jgi:caffeoyl-CoA O-methyltransferase
MLSGHVMGRFLKLLVQASGAKTVLEIGTYTGYSALSMAEGLPDDGQLVTCEINEEHAKLAQKYIEKSEHGHKVLVLVGDALDNIIYLEQDQFRADLIFLDADKEHYPDYYGLLVPLLNPGGIMVVDNALWSGEVLNPKNPDAIGIARLNRTMTEDDRIENVLLTVRDGVMIGRKR